MQTNKVNFFDMKTILILVMGIIIIGMFLFGKNVINKHESEIKALHTENTSLLSKNDSLKNNNLKLDVILAKIDAKLEKNNEDTNNVLTELGKLKGKKNEIPNYVNSLSANGTADALSKYLEGRTKSQTSSKH